MKLLKKHVKVVVKLADKVSYDILSELSGRSTTTVRSWGKEENAGGDLTEGSSKALSILLDNADKILATADTLEEPDAPEHVAKYQQAIKSVASTATPKAKSKKDEATVQLKRTELGAYKRDLRKKSQKKAQKDQEKISKNLAKLQEDILSATEKDLDLQAEMLYTQMFNLLVSKLRVQLAKQFPQISAKRREEALSKAIYEE